MRKFLLSTVALAALAGSALAADLPSTKAPPVFVTPAPAFSWTGVYIGVEGGVDFLNASAHSSVVLRDFGSHQTSGLLGGVVGYNYQINQFVLGIEGDAGGVLGSNNTVTTTTIGGTATTSNSYFADIRGRLGFAVAERALLYVAGGVAVGAQKTAYTLPAQSFTSSRTGWTIGGGLDYAFTNNWIGRVEYRYTDLGTATYTFAPGAFDRARLTSNAVLVGLMYKFGAPEPVAVVAKY
jgi:outer membrane immunogenic protein